MSSVYARFDSGDAAIRKRCSLLFPYEGEMNRNVFNNSHSSEFLVQQLQIPPGAEITEWRRVIPQTMPPGWRNYARWVNDATLEIGIEPIPPEKPTAKDQPKADNYMSKPLADLQTLCAMKGIKYDVTMNKTQLIAMLRAV